jgi:hypothetical protein
MEFISSEPREDKEGSFTGNFDSRSFAVSEFRNPLWVYELKKMADQALAYGAKLASIDNLFPKYVEIKDHLMERAK